MPRRITETQRQAVLRMLAQGVDRETIATSVGITPGQVSAVAAHVKMGTYTLPADVGEERETIPEERERTRIADTFARVYPRIGVRQHAVLRQAVLDVMADEGIVPDGADSWGRDLPAFGNVQRKLVSYVDSPNNPQGRFAASVASHISTLFVFNTFCPNGQKLAWPEMIEADSGVFIIQLKGLEYSLERAVTEFLLWNLIGYVEALGPSPLRCFIVLDEAHKLSFDQGSPVEKLLREGRKFGLGLILASQQPEDFSPVAFANTATKIVFQVGDEKSTIFRRLHPQSYTRIMRASRAESRIGI